MPLKLNSAVLECRFMSNEQWGFPAMERGTAAIVRGHMLPTKGTFHFTTNLLTSYGSFCST